MPAAASTPPDRIRFDTFELDTATGELFRDGAALPLPDQPLQVLLALLDRPGRIVSREELRGRLWPDDTFVDFEHGLNAAVKRLRDALGDSADQPRCIETLPRRGYRFIARVHDPEPLSPAPALKAFGRTPRELGWVSTALLGLLLTLTGAVWYRGLDLGSAAGDRQAPLARELTRVTFDPGFQTDPSWSPDGRHLAYAGDTAGNFDIWIRSLESGEPRRLTTSDASEHQPAWSPDGQRIAFRSERDGGGLFVVGAGGGPERRLTTFGERPEWMPRGSEILFRSSGLLTQLFVVAADGDGAPRPVLGDFMRLGDWLWAGMHPDGRISLAGTHRTLGFALFTMDRDGGHLVVSTPPASLRGRFGLDEPHPSFRFRWAPSGEAVYIEVTPNDLSTLWRMPSSNGVPVWTAAERLTTGPGNATAAAVSPGGARLAFTNDVRETRAWVFPFDDVAARITGRGEPVTPVGVSISGVSLTPDGRALVYEASRPGNPTATVVRQDLGDGAIRELAARATAPVASPDGQRFVYVLNRSADAGAGGGPATEFALALQTATGAETLLSAWSRSVMIPSHWRADDGGVIGSHGREWPTGPVSLALWPVDGLAGEPASVLLFAPEHRFWQARYAPNGRWVSFVAGRSDRAQGTEMGIVAADVRNAGWTRVAASHKRPDKPRWSSDGRTLYFVSDADGQYNLWAVRMDAELGRPIGDAFQVTRFNSPELAIEPDMVRAEIDIGAGRLVLTMTRATGSIWLLSGSDR